MPVDGEGFEPSGEPAKGTPGTNRRPCGQSVGPSLKLGPTNLRSVSYGGGIGPTSFQYRCERP